MQYSIWIIPPEPIFSQLKNVIKKLSVKYDSPIFEPHMTLLGNINQSLPGIEQKITELASYVNRLELSLGPISFSTTYFQSVFVRVNSTARLTQLNLDVKKLFNMENNVFMPHISLLYGNHDMTIREKAASEVQLPLSSFVANEFIVAPSTSDPNQWKHSLTISFGFKN
ncbi:MAG: hypothetical protein A3A94_00525 [Candidatus Portnoybacteria bacterium RIFCSPLOWO2_01_FULL_43_11]|uniref:Cyclic phosphodiesterase-like protein n=3 Tax=Candidatus Portnoyibacteriota TaxID=1817913 RepID=A0A1G2FAM3_9BACT|nr:MAG: hypothetical protein A2815_02115 [Candidatus Portnoybacteria bacterium RIFCSPHIGHO2_01_FULL_40_12b]OGZ36976.1 MAG: hypothetical protein A3D38_00645 [Candidatus Portnoybacteria bacterium RIFCSPHIGHO2_02_FULL_40_23]OGZ38333.1 MAG: hypothetical protein A3A94_00525 [Candidatus Portnoybacteria bacterium RIFCSPLOWO2_01_FULL_43_11]OGZ41187.1 MAG: hypothetical protein A3I20_02570 [Candidatus Portnoybacteria bacterium RIFCSPLOWO2_02_FULL_40_15]